MQNEREEGAPVAEGRRESEKGVRNDESPESEKHFFQGSPESPDDPNAAAAGHTPPEEDTTQYVSGAKLYAIVISLVLASFLMLLDTSIVSTVR